MQEFHSFPPIVPAQADILILGSMPGIRSIKDKQYYAHPQNAFWPMLASIYASHLKEEELEKWKQGRHHQIAFRQKHRLLEQAHIALWDALSSCQRQNSADHSIRNASCNPIADLVKRTGIRNILLNGRKSSALFHKNITPDSGFRVFTLPSSSPAHAALTFQEKLKIWKATLENASG
ncbi:MAG: DNA-deoxyinosine glycosylase [Spirochaetota bacterium]